VIGPMIEAEIREQLREAAESLLNPTNFMR
jgi:hypothetical protein